MRTIVAATAIILLLVCGCGIVGFLRVRHRGLRRGVIYRWSSLINKLQSLQRKRRIWSALGTHLKSFKEKGKQL